MAAPHSSVLPTDSRASSQWSERSMFPWGTMIRLPTNRGGTILKTTPLACLAPPKGTLLGPTRATGVALLASVEAKKLVPGGHPALSHPQNWQRPG